MRERVLPQDHPDIVTSLSSAGHTSEAMKENQRALEYFEKALEIRAKFLPKDDSPVRKRTERHVLGVRWKINILIFVFVFSNVLSNVFLFIFLNNIKIYSRRHTIMFFH
jgi:hypothetical protein